MSDQFHRGVSRGNILRVAISVSLINNSPQPIPLPGIPPRQDSNSCRFTEVCSRCTSECGSELEEGSTIDDLETLPTCEDAPEGSVTTARGEQ